MPFAIGAVEVIVAESCNGRVNERRIWVGGNLARAMVHAIQHTKRTTYSTYIVTGTKPYDWKFEHAMHHPTREPGPIEGIYAFRYPRSGNLPCDCHKLPARVVRAVRGELTTKVH